MLAVRRCEGVEALRHSGAEAPSPGRGGAAQGAGSAAQHRSCFFRASEAGGRAGGASGRSSVSPKLLRGGNDARRRKWPRAEAPDDTTTVVDTQTHKNVQTRHMPFILIQLFLFAQTGGCSDRCLNNTELSQRVEEERLRLSLPDPLKYGDDRSPTTGAQNESVVCQLARLLNAVSIDVRAAATGLITGVEMARTWAVFLSFEATRAGGCPRRGGSAYLP